MRYPNTVLITGANGQSAVATARALLEQKCKLLLLTHKRTERIDGLIDLFPDSCFAVQCDLSCFEQTETAVQELLIKSELIPEAVIHTSAIRSYDTKTLAESEPAIWNSIVTQNISMAYNILRCVLPLMIKANQGKIVLFGSNVTRTGLPNGSAYAAAKAAMANLTRTVALEIAKHNIQINVISPAPVETNLEEDYHGVYLKFRQDYFSAYKKTHPQGRLVSMNDITQTVLSLINMDVQSVSGEEIYLTGGVL